MRRYETFVIFDPDITEENRLSFFDKIKNLISENNGHIAEFDEWGVRKLAYEIKKKIRGHYTRIDFLTSPAVVEEIERLIHIDDRIMKYMTIILDRDTDIETVQKDILRRKEKKEVVIPNLADALEDSSEFSDDDEEDIDADDDDKSHSQRSKSARKEDN